MASGRANDGRGEELFGPRIVAVYLEYARHDADLLRDVGEDDLASALEAWARDLLLPPEQQDGVTL